jgi:hypothetical protein
MSKRKFPYLSGGVLILLLVVLVLPQFVMADPVKGLRLSFHVGATYPLGSGSIRSDDPGSIANSLNYWADSNVHFRFDLTYRLSDKIDLMVFSGFSQFTDDNAANVHVHYYTFNYSANVKWLFPTATGLKWYVQGGPGLYVPKPGLIGPYPTGNTVGFNVGWGAQIPLTGPFDIEWGVDLHNINLSSDDQPKYWFLTLQLGVLFR